MRIDPSTLSSRKVKLPSATSAPAYWLMMISVGITIPIILSLIAIFMALTYEFWMWVFGAFAGLFILIGITLFLTGLGIAIYLTTSRQWHAFVGWWLDRLARLKDRFSSVRSSTRLIRKELADTETGSGFFISMAEPQRFPKRPIERLTFEDDRVTMIAASRAGKDALLSFQIWPDGKDLRSVMTQPVRTTKSLPNIAAKCSVKKLFCLIRLESQETKPTTGTQCWKSISRPTRWR